MLFEGATERVVMRTQYLNRIDFGSSSVLMQSFVDPWGEDDVVVGAISGGEAWERGPMKHWMSMCALAQPGDIIVDCGAYTGIYSLMACACNAAVKAVAIEASALTFGRLVTNSYLNGFDSRIVPCHYALYDDRALLQLEHQYGYYTMASGEAIRGSYLADHLEAVPSISFDSLFGMDGTSRKGPLASKAIDESFGRRILAIKIDAEGAEETILHFAVESLRVHRPFILLEILDSLSKRRIDLFLAELGYKETSALDASNYVYCHRENADLLERQLSTLGAQSETFQLQRLSKLSPISLRDK
jgi:FkbM family methyltransferase